MRHNRNTVLPLLFLIVVLPSQNPHTSNIRSKQLKAWTYDSYVRPSGVGDTAIETPERL